MPGEPTDDVLPPADLGLGAPWRRQLTSRADSGPACHALIGRARREVLVYGPDLTDPLADAPETIDLLRNCIRHQRRFQLRVLTTRQVAPRHEAPRLVQLWHKLGSQVAVREPLAEEPPPPDHVFVLVDRRGLYYRPECSSGHGVLDLADGGRAHQLGELFDSQWRRSQPVHRHRRTFI